MKKFILIFFLLFSSSITNAITINKCDTSVATQTINVNIVGNVMHELFTSFTFAKFDGAIIFMDSYVDFNFTQADSTLLTENMTDVKAIETLNQILKNIHYANFKITSTKNIKLENVLIADLIILKDGIEYYLECSFTLNNDGQIISILFY